MAESPLNLLILIPFFVLLEAFFSGSEIAIVSIPKYKIKQYLREGDKKAKLLLKFLEEPEKLLSTTLIGTNFSTVSGASLLTYILYHYVPNYAEILTPLIYTPITLTFGELIPKSIFQKYAEKLALKIIYPLVFFYYLFRPFIFFLNLFTKVICKIFGIENDKTPFVTKEELELLLKSDMTSMFDEKEKQIIKNIFYAKDKSLGDIYVPLNKVVALSSNSKIKDLKRVIKKYGFSRYPVFENRIDNIIGIVKIDDALKSNLDIPVVSIMKPPLYLPEYMNIFDALRIFKDKKDSIAVVVDEYGSTLGIITLEDILEEIVGRIDDEFDKTPLIQKTLNGVICDPTIEITEINRFLKKELPMGTDYSTVSGLILKTLGKFPNRGEIIDFPHHLIKILDVSPRKIEKVLIIEKSKSFKENKRTYEKSNSGGH